MIASDLIALGEVIQIDRRGIHEVKGYHRRRQEVTIKFRIKQILLGEAPPAVTIRAYSTSYLDDGTW